MDVQHWTLKEFSKKLMGTNKLPVPTTKQQRSTTYPVRLTISRANASNVHIHYLMVQVAIYKQTTSIGESIGCIGSMIWSTSIPVVTRLDN